MLNCWNPLRVSSATTQPETVIVNAENGENWAISSQAPEMEKVQRLASDGVDHKCDRNGMPTKTKSEDIVSSSLKEEGSGNSSSGSSNERVQRNKRGKPNASSADLAGTSPSIEPWYRNIFVKDTRVGSFVIKNKYLERILEEKGYNNKAIWNSILENDGSVQHLPFLNDLEKAVFKCAVEMDQHWLVELADQRGGYICQAQSLNLFFRAGMSRKYVNSVHLKFLRSPNVITLYYYRNEREGKVDTAKDIERKALVDWSEGQTDCVACQG